MKSTPIIILVVLGLMLAACAPATTMPLVTPITDATIAPVEPVNTAVPSSPQPVNTESAVISASPACNPGTALFREPDAQSAAVIAALPEVTIQDHMRGNPEAKITILEYSDFM